MLRPIGATSVVLAFALIPLKTLAQQDVANRNAVLVLEGAWLIDGTGEPVAENAWIRIEGERVAAMGQGHPPRTPGAEVMDLKGKTVLPGLSDMHVHFYRLEEARWILKLLLSYGVTNVREAGTDLDVLAAVREWMETEEAVPHLYTSGLVVNGVEDLQFADKGTALRRLRINAAFGVDFLKVWNWVSTEALWEAVRFANQHNLYVAGHVPLGMTSVAAIDAGMRTLEHVRLRPAEVLDVPELIARYPIDVPYMRRIGYWAHFDPDAVALRRTLDAWSERKDRFFLNPTLVIQEADARSYDLPVTEVPGVELVSHATLESWKASNPRKQWGDLSDQELAEAKAGVSAMTEFVGMAHAQGIRILTGSDIGGGRVVPGVSLHRELQLLVQAGLSPVEVIHSSTGLAAQALRVEERGTVAPGQVADLVVVDGNLSNEIHSLGQIEQIILAGRVYSRTRLFEEALRLAAIHQPPGPEGSSEE